jgi:hypothetical protein
VCVKNEVTAEIEVAAPAAELAHSRLVGTNGY